MKKLLVFAVLVTVITGCAGGPQATIDAYVVERNKIIQVAKRAKCKKDCIYSCNTLSNTIDRVDCKARCVEVCEVKANGTD